jgi:hypothetical protein
MTINLGNTSKNSTYLSDLKKAIAPKLDHPRHHGVRMQAHHVISCEGMRLSGLGDKIEQFGYDINLLPNLSFIPCTLQGACHLGVQPHRGNHTALADQDAYDDDLENERYHKIVAGMVMELKRLVFQECQADREAQCKRVINKLNKMSKQILRRIQDDPGKAPLTSIAKHFIHGNKIGCGGVDSVTLHSEHIECPSRRNHKGKQGITYESNGKYQLETGR